MPQICRCWITTPPRLRAIIFQDAGDHVFLESFSHSLFCSAVLARSHSWWSFLDSFCHSCKCPTWSFYKCNAHFKYRCNLYIYVMMWPNISSDGEHCSDIFQNLPDWRRPLRSEIIKDVFAKLQNGIRSQSNFQIFLPLYFFEYFILLGGWNHVS